mmetsp:Transcript_7736/g.32588  ORF Transcript_7736/g.32588 Transcript_7736/m.32588 type:complete len:435 (-) Transcript_7736:319-1623(-)
MGCVAARHDHLLGVGQEQAALLGELADRGQDHLLALLALREAGDVLRTAHHRLDLARQLRGVLSDCVRVLRRAGRERGRGVVELLHGKLEDVHRLLEALANRRHEESSVCSHELRVEVGGHVLELLERLLDLLASADGLNCLASGHQSLDGGTNAVCCVGELLPLFTVVHLAQARLGHGNQLRGGVRRSLRSRHEAGLGLLVLGRGGHGRHGADELDHLQASVLCRASEVGVSARVLDIAAGCSYDQVRALAGEQHSCLRQALQSHLGCKGGGDLVDARNNCPAALLQLGALAGISWRLAGTLDRRHEATGGEGQALGRREQRLLEVGVFLGNLLRVVHEAARRASDCLVTGEDLGGTRVRAREDACLLADRVTSLDDAEEGRAAVRCAAGALNELRDGVGYALHRSIQVRQVLGVAALRLEGTQESGTALGER